MPRFTVRRIRFGHHAADPDDEGEGLPLPKLIRLRARRAAGIAEATPTRTIAMPENARNCPPFDDLPTAKVLQCAEMRAMGASTRCLAKKFQVDPTTIRRWMREPAAQKVIAEIRDQSVSKVAGLLLSRAKGWIDELERIIQNKRSEDAVRIRALTFLLDKVIVFNEQTNLSARLAVLEKAMRRHKAGKVI
jgi:hypothetical protein